MAVNSSQNNQDHNTNTGYLGELEIGGLGLDFSNLGAATSSATSSAPVTFSTGSKQVLSGSSSASDTMSGLLKIGLSIAGLTALFYFLRGRK